MKKTILPLDVLHTFLSLSPWSMGHIAQSFGVSRTNLVSFLHGRPAIGSQKALELLDWAGLYLDPSGALRLQKGVHLWKVASERELESLLRIPKSLLDPEQGVDIFFEIGVTQRDWLHLLIRSTEGQILLSLRPQVFFLLRDQHPHWNRPHAVYRHPSGWNHQQIIAFLGGQGRIHIPESEQNQHFQKAQPDYLQKLADWNAWAEWASYQMGIKLPGSEPHSLSGEQKTDETACRHAWRTLRHRLEVPDGVHPEIVDVPIFPLPEQRLFPEGLVRLDRLLLGAQAFQLAREGKIRLYVDSRSDKRWLIQTASALPCGRLTPWGEPVPSGHPALYLRGDRLEISSAPGGTCLGLALACLQDIVSPDPADLDW